MKDKIKQNNLDLVNYGGRFSFDTGIFLREDALTVSSGQVVDGLDTIGYPYCTYADNYKNHGYGDQKIKSTKCTYVGTGKMLLPTLILSCNLVLNKDLISNRQNEFHCFFPFNKRGKIYSNRPKLNLV